MAELTIDVLPDQPVGLDAFLKRIIRTYPEWAITREGEMWTATRRPTPTSLHFIYASNLDQLACKLRRAPTVIRQVMRVSQMMRTGRGWT